LLTAFSQLDFRISRWALAHGSLEEPDAGACRLILTTLIFRCDDALRIVRIIRIEGVLDILRGLLRAFGNVLCRTLDGLPGFLRGLPGFLLRLLRTSGEASQSHQDKQPHETVHGSLL
jgi:hypothetical protein